MTPERNVRVYTVNDESRYVMVHNIPAIGVIDELLKRMSLYGNITSYRVVDEDAKESFTQAMWIQYETVNNARHAKVHAAQKSFYGSRLKVQYVPEYESRNDTADKLNARRELLQRRAKSSRARSCQNNIPIVVETIMSAHEREEAPGKVFIGPQLPSQKERRQMYPEALPPKVNQKLSIDLTTAKKERNKRRRI